MKAGAVNNSDLSYPRCSRMARWAGMVWLRLFGWQMEGTLPEVPKFLVIFSPHTSNWDGIMLIPAGFAFGVKFNFLAKKELFFGPIGAILRGMGGIPVDRRAPKDLVGQIVDAIEEREQVVIGIAPEGTRSLTKYWKSGFYHIAYRVNIPLSFAYLDYKRKVVGFDEGIILTGDSDMDMQKIRQFYSNVNAKYPDNVGPVAFRSKRRIRRAKQE